MNDSYNNGFEKHVRRMMNDGADAPRCVREAPRTVLVGDQIRGRHEATVEPRGHPFHVRDVVVEIYPAGTDRAATMQHRRAHARKLANRLLQLHAQKRV